MPTCAILTRPGGERIAINCDHVKSIIARDNGQATIILVGDDEVNLGDTLAEAIIAVFDKVRASPKADATPL